MRKLPRILFAITTFISVTAHSASSIRTASKIVSLDADSQPVQLAGELCRTPENSACAAIEIKNVTFMLPDGSVEQHPSVIIAGHSIDDIRSDLTKAARVRFVDTQKDIVLADPTTGSGETLIANLVTGDPSSALNLVGIREATNLKLGK
jgi:hypothetical protein